jgi:ABC-type multidrug transport system ATPase subunit
VDQLIKSEPLVVKNLIKNYRRGSKLFCAVNRLNFGIKKGECFGLLGLNGAGKTTLLKMLIGELKSTNGQIFINGFNYNKNYSKARQNLGYCPQFSYLPEFLNVEECLELFADLRGIHRLSTLEILDDLIKLFKLERFKKRKIQHLSEGNKRKLSAALSFLGKPQVVILDEVFFLSSNLFFSFCIFN